MANSCSHWWHAPFYIAVSIALAFIAISSLHQEPETHNSSSSPSSQILIKRNLSLNASRALRSHGFNVMATLLQFSPELFFSTPESTVFAVQDSTISNISGHLPPRAMKQLLQYHTSPAKLPFQALLKKPQQSCLTTLLPKILIKITRIDEEKGLVEINNAQITHPDLFLDGPFSVHGVLGSFAPIHPHLDKDLNLIIQSEPNCENFTHVSVKQKFNPIQWFSVVQFLSTNGFSTFAIGLQSVVDGIVADYGEMGSATIFAPSYFGFLAMPSPLLDRAVRLHILPQRYSYTELAFMAEGSALKTLADGEDVELHKTDSSGAMAVDGVAITAAEIFVSKDVIIHGISGSLGASG